MRAHLAYRLTESHASTRTGRSVGVKTMRWRCASIVTVWAAYTAGQPRAAQNAL
jgi:hypothetical protein